MGPSQHNFELKPSNETGEKKGTGKRAVISLKTEEAEEHR